jgi:hypothetical protein
MKSIAMMGILVALLSGCATLNNEGTEERPTSLAYVIDVPSYSAIQLQKLNARWIAETYISAESVITFRDDEASVIKGSAIGTISWLSIPVDFHYQLTIENKDGKTRLTFSGINRDLNMASSIYFSAKEYLDSLAAGLKQFLNTSPDTSTW